MTEQLCIYLANEMAEFAKRQNQYPTKFGKLNLEIDSIDNLACDAKLSFTNNRIDLDINTNEWFPVENEEDYDPFCLFTKRYGPIANPTPEEIKPIIDEIIADLEQLKFSKLQSSFKLGEQSTMLDFLGTLKNIKVGSECCVCYDKTKFQTICKHSLCIPCITNMKDSDGGEDGSLECPMCRTRIANK